MSDKRQYARHCIELSVCFSGDEVSYQGVVLDLSVRGCRVSSKAIIFPGEFLAMLISLPGRDVPLAIGLAAVRWSIGREFGVEFIRMEPECQALLHRLIQNLERSFERPSVKSTMPAMSG